jgi:hypothetical protein
MSRQNRDMAVIGQFFRVCTFKNGTCVALVFGNCYENIDLEIFHKTVNGFVKIIFCNKIKLGLIVFKHFPQFILSFLVFFGDSNEMRRIHIYDMEAGTEHFQDCINQN